MDSSNNIYVAYSFYKDGFSNPPMEITTTSGGLDIESSLSGSIDSSTTIITVADASTFLPAGTLKAGNATITYTSKTETTFTGCTNTTTAASGVTIKQESYREVRFRKLTYSGGNWAVSIPKRINTVLSTGGRTDPRIYKDNSNRLWATTRSEKHCWFSDDDGITWLAPSTTLTGTIAASATSITVADNTYFPDGIGTVRFDNEYISLGGKSGTTLFTNCTRARLGTVAATHTSGLTIYDDNLTGVTHDTTLLLNANNTTVLLGGGGGVNNSIQQTKWNGTGFVLSYVTSYYVSSSILDWSGVVTNDNVIHLAFRDINAVGTQTYKGIKYRYCDSGGTWNTVAANGSNEIMIDINDNDDQPSLTTDGTNVYCFFKKYITAVKSNIVYSKLNTTTHTWSTPVSITTDAMDNQYPSACLRYNASSGYVPVSWSAWRSLNLFSVRYWRITLPPTVTNVTPATNSNLSATTVTLTGNSFYGSSINSAVTGITIATAPPTEITSDYSVVSDTTITNVVIPQGLFPGTYDIRVSNGSGDPNGGTNVTSTVKFVITAPAVTVTNLTPAQGSNTSPNTLTVWGGGFFGGVGSNTVTSVKLDTSPTPTTIVPGYAVTSDTMMTGVIIPVEVAAGTYNIIVAAAGGTNSTSTDKFVCKIGPRVTSIAPISGSNLSISTVTINGSGYWPSGSDAVTSIKLMDGGTEIAGITGYTAISDSIIQTGKIAGGLSPGSYWVKVTTINGSNATGAYYGVTTNIPVVSSLNPGIGGDTCATTISINGSGFFAGTTSSKITEIRLETTPTPTYLSGYSVISNSLIKNVIISGLAVGTYDVKVKSAGLYENVSGTIFTIQNGPRVISLSSNISSNLTATTITVNGQFFNGASEVRLDDPLNTLLDNMVAADPDSTITGIIPAGLYTGVYNVKVKTNEGINILSDEKFTVTGISPAVSTVVPAVNLNTSATTVTITGTGFYAGTGSNDVVNISMVGPTTKVLAAYSVKSDVLIDGVEIPGLIAAGTYDIRVKTHGGENSTSGIRFVVTALTPVVNTITPQTNTNFIATTVTITGTSFFGGTATADVLSVKIGTTEFGSYSVVNDTNISGVVPAAIAAGSYEILVTTHSGVNITSAQKFIITTISPSVTNLSPNKGGNTGFTAISIIGTGFFGGTVSSAVSGIQLDTVIPTDLTSFSVVSDLLINANIPVGVAAGTDNIKVSIGGGTNSISTVKYRSKIGPEVVIFTSGVMNNTIAGNIDIEGLNFWVDGVDAVTSIRLNDPSNTEFATWSVSDSQNILGCAIPTGIIAGTYDVRVTTSNGTNASSTQKFIVNTNPPTVVSIGPIVADNTCSSYISIIGTGFYGGITTNNVSSIRLEGSTNTVISEYSVVNNTKIVNVRIPLGTTPGVYEVRTVTGGGISATNNVMLTVNTPSISITEILPVSVLNTASATLTIKGGGFFAGMASSMVTSIKLDDVMSTAFTGWTVLSDTEVRNLIIPSGVNSGRYNIQVTASGITNATSSAKFDVILDSSVGTTQMVESANGVRLSVPSGALSGNTVFLINDVSTSGTIVSSNKYKYSNIRLWPYLDSSVREITLTDGVVINSGYSVTLTLTYTGVNDPVLEGKFRVLRLGADNNWAFAAASDTVDFLNHRVSSVISSFSIFRIGQYVNAASNLDNVVVFPNPIDFDTAARSTVKFKNLTSNPIVRIYSVSGDLIKTINPQYEIKLTGTINDGVSGEAEWNGTNEREEKVARGLYLYMINDDLGRKKIGKIVVK